jgi:hypothetical protein
LVILQNHVDDGTGHEHDDGGQQYGEPESGERNHAQPPEENGSMAEELSARLSEKEVEVKS